MRGIIQKLAKGKFEYERPEVSFSTERVDIELSGGKDYTGEFTVKSTNRVPMRGIVYTSNSRMECLNPRIEGEKITVRYRFHSEGLTGGDIQKGDFYFVMNQGEYNLSFVVAINKLSANTQSGRIRSMKDFVRLAEEDIEEASRLFYSPNFKNIIGQGERHELLLYEGLSKGSVSVQRIEEFLVGIHKKSPVSIRLEKNGAKYTGVDGDRLESIELQKSHWGYIDIRVSSDAAFLEPAKERLSNADFLGSVCPFTYYIREDALHAGNNYGRLTFSLLCQELVYEVCATRNAEEKREEASAHRQKREARIRLSMLYVDYRLRKIVTGVWANQSVEILNRLIALKDENVRLYSLMKAQAFLMNKQRQEASWIMEDFKRSQSRKDVPEWGYYLYLCTLMDREPVFVDRMAEEIEQIFMRNQDNSLLFWILLYIREEYYKDSTRKLKVLRQRIMQGCKSPYLYVEVYYLFQKEPYLIKEIGDFELGILNWAVKQKAMTEEIARQLMRFAPGRRGYAPALYRILQACYEVCPEGEMLGTLCSYLIKCQCYGREYRQWYERGIEEQLRITGLYEAYLMSLDTREVTEVPKLLQMYFQYESGLPDKQKAVLFVNIIAKKDKQPEIYKKYQEAIVQFTIEQVEAGNIDENLAVIYQDILKIGFLNEELAEKLAKVLFTWRITCTMPAVVRAFIFAPWQKEPQVVRFTNKAAYFTAYSKDFCVVLEDNVGNRYAESVPYLTEPLMHVGSYLERCHTLAPGAPEYHLYALMQKKWGQEVFLTDADAFLAFLKTADIGESYRQELLLERIYIGKIYGYIDDIKKYLALLDFTGIPVAKRREMTGLLAEYGMVDTAYRLVRDYGYDYVEGPAREKICTRAVVEAEFEEDDFLVGLSGSVFFDGGGNESILIYLCRYFQGPTKQMAQIWKAAEQLSVDTFELEERILTQMLYTTDYIAYAGDIYNSYLAGGGKEQLCMAYLTYFANAYLTHDALVPVQVFVQIYEKYKSGAAINPTCKIGLLKYFSEQPPATDVQRQILDRLLQENIAEGRFFGFYRRYGRDLLKKYYLFDKQFVEYRTKPGLDITISYRSGESAYQREDMTEMYDGIFVKDFTLFDGESIQYYITEARNAQEKVTESGCLEAEAVTQSGTYGRLNELSAHVMECTSQTEQANYGRLKMDMKEYVYLQRLTEEMFDLL